MSYLAHLRVAFGTEYLPVGRDFLNGHFHVLPADPANYPLATTPVYVVHFLKILHADGRHFQVNISGDNVLDGELHDYFPADYEVLDDDTVAELEADIAASYDGEPSWRRVAHPEPAIMSQDAVLSSPDKVKNPFFHEGM
eukprot:gene25901-11576_t